LRQDGDGRNKQGSSREADTDALGQHEMPVFRGDAGHHQAESEQEGAKQQQHMKVAGIEQWSDDHPKHHQQKGLDRANPGDGRRGQIREIMLLIIRLKGTKSVDDAPKTVSASSTRDEIESLSYLDSNDRWGADGPYQELKNRKNDPTTCNQAVRPVSKPCSPF
jgi:hypothetical protein